MADQRRNGSGRRDGSGPSGLSGPEAIERVRRDLPQLLGRPIEAVLGLERDDDRNWQVMVQIVELARVPSSTDVLGAYAVTIGSDGELLGYRRRRRYHRNQADED